MGYGKLAGDGDDLDGKKPLLVNGNGNDDQRAAPAAPASSSAAAAADPDAKPPPDAMGSPQALWVKPLAYAALNIASASGIVFANKMVFDHFGFKFTVALTWVHTAVTWVGINVMLKGGMFQAKSLPAARLLPLALAFVGYIVLCNLSLNLNTVGFYQVMKIAVAPTVFAMESVAFRRRPERRVAASVGVVCLGNAIATLTDKQVTANAKGAIVGVAATLVTGLYQLWVGTKQRELGASSMQLLHQYTPIATAAMALLIPLVEPVGWAHLALAGRGAGGAGGADGQGVDLQGLHGGGGEFGDGTLLGYRYTPQAVAAILFSAGLGLLVSLSTFLVIGATSSLTYNVVGHLKTVIILTGGCLLFGDQMPGSKLAGLGVAMAGIVWYTHIKMSPSAASVVVAGGGGGGAAGGGKGAGSDGGASGGKGSGGGTRAEAGSLEKQSSEAMESGQALLGDNGDAKSA